MNRRKFINYIGCGCLAFGLHSCSTTPITERKQLKLIPEHKLNAQAAKIYEKVKEKEKLSDDKVKLGEIKEIGDHNSLNKSGGYYRRLYEMQNKNILT